MEVDVVLPRTNTTTHKTNTTKRKPKKSNAGNHHQNTTTINNGTSIAVVKKYVDYCILQVSRGVGPRTIGDVWLPVQAESDLFLPLAVGDGGEADTTTTTATTTTLFATHALQVSPHYKAYAQGLVLIARDLAAAHRVTAVTLTVHALCQGYFAPGSDTHLHHQLHASTKNIHATPNEVSHCVVRGMAVAPSNTVGYISLELQNVAPPPKDEEEEKTNMDRSPPATSTNSTTKNKTITPFLASRQFRKQLKAAGCPILGNAEDGKSFRGNPLCMAVVQLHFQFQTRLHVQQEETMTIPPAPRLGTIFEREQKFWDQKNTAVTTTTDGSSSSSLPRPPPPPNHNHNHNHNNSIAVVSPRLAHAPPAAYAVGETHFDGLTLAVTPAVMIPRPGSQAVVQRALALLEAQQPPHQPHASCSSIRVLDLGTGSGCLLLAILSRLVSSSSSSSSTKHTNKTEVMGVGMDKSTEALKVAKRNAKALGLESHCQLLEGDFAQLGDLVVVPPPTTTTTDASNSNDTRSNDTAFDIVVCNPPYHTRGGRKQLDATSLVHEPAMALFVDNHHHSENDKSNNHNNHNMDMLIHYRNVLEGLTATAPPLIQTQRTVLVFEVFKDNAHHVVKMMKDHGLQHVQIGKDARGCIRTAEGIY